MSALGQRALRKSRNVAAALSEVGRLCIGLKQKDTVHLYHPPADLSGDPHPPGFIQA